MQRLPRNPTQGKDELFRSLLLIGPPKIGKTDNLMKLKNNLLIDLQDRSSQFDGMSLNIPDIVKRHNNNPKNTKKMTAYRALTFYSKRIEEANKEAGKCIYDYITLDALKDIEDIARIKALANYKLSPNANMNVKDIVNDLSYGKGYDYLRMATMEIINKFAALAGKCFILVGHVKETKIEILEGEDITIMDLDLVSNATKRLLCVKLDAIGKFYKHEENPDVNIISFINETNDRNIGATASHLVNKKFIISKRNPKTGEIKTYWDKIFIN